MIARLGKGPATAFTTFCLLVSAATALPAYNAIRATFASAPPLVPEGKGGDIVVIVVDKRTEGRSKFAIRGDIYLDKSRGWLSDYAAHAGVAKEFVEQTK